MTESLEIAAWLATHVDGITDVEIGEFDRPGSGFSAETVIFPASFTRAGDRDTTRFVLRRETPDPAVYPPQAPGLDVEIDIQYRVMQALADGSEIPIAPLVGYEPDSTIIGAPFFVMEFVAGEVPIENPIYTQAGFFVDGAPDERLRLVEHGLRVLARVHAFDWRAAGLDWLIAPGADPSTARQLAIWEQYGIQELAGRVHPLLDRAYEYLHAEPPHDEAPVLNWGDPRPGNVIWDDFAPACVTDFEAASIAPPLVDLGWWLMFDRWSHETMGAERLAGEPTRAEQTELYAGYVGRDVPDTRYFEILAAARYAVIVVRVMNRLVARGDMPADQMIWLENPASTCLAQLLDEL